MTDILSFQGEFRWLSNFAPVKIILDGRPYPSVEHAYMSAKNNDSDWKLMCADPNNKPGQIKRLSMGIKLKDGWERDKLIVMRDCLEQKYKQEPYKSKLLSTGTAHLEEGNTWGDSFWGVDLITRKGKNNLGILIMEIRTKLTPKTK